MPWPALGEAVGWDIRSAATLFEASGSLGKLTQPLVIGDRGLACATSRGNILWNNASFNLPIIPGPGLIIITFARSPSYSCTFNPRRANRET